MGADQLVGGVWPDNEPAVSCLDWQTGEPNAKYWAVQMLANALGSVPKTIYNSTVTSTQNTSLPTTNFALAPPQQAATLSQEIIRPTRQSTNAIRCPRVQASHTIAT